jgi:thiamine biosynthesis lipoprotein
VPDHYPDSRRLSRRQFLKISAVAGAVLAGGRLLQRSTTHALPTLRETRTLMGTVVNLALVCDDADEGNAAIAATFAKMERLIALFDHRLPHGPLGRLNRDGYLAPAPRELVDLLTTAVAYGDLSDGAFDVTVKPLLDALRQGTPSTAPVAYKSITLTEDTITLATPGMAITLDGIGKGRVVDGATAVLRARGYDNVLVEAGGDLVARGRRAGDLPWRVGIAHPRPATAATPLLTTLAISECAVATSGDYTHSFTQDHGEHHIIDPRQGAPRNGRSPAELAAVTILAPTATAADALGTAVLVLGVDAGLTLLQDLPGVAGLLVTKEMVVHRTANMPVGNETL